jgi:hypothetical protein
MRRLRIERLRDLAWCLRTNLLTSQDRGDLLSLVSSAIAVEERRSTGGRPVTETREVAAVVGVLCEKHGAALKAALSAAAPDASAAKRASIERTYRALRSSGETVYAPALRVRGALARLRK